LAKNRNTFEKSRRELDKKRQAEEKRLRRKNRQSPVPAPLVTPTIPQEDTEIVTPATP